MSLRPRYSLLTLLVVMALVAGGVKWWRGPHRVLLSNPRTGAEHAILWKLCCTHPLLEDATQHIELSYTNQLTGKVYETLMGRPQTTVYFFLKHSKSPPLLMKWELKRNKTLAPATERLQSWLCRFPTPETVGKIEDSLRGNACGAAQFLLEREHRFYIISTHGRLFKSEGGQYADLCMCDLMEPAAIDDPLILAWYDAETQSLGKIKK
jgi:hypothetical protein